MLELPLRFATPQAWTTAVMGDFDHFLLDHAAAEKKASGMAISMLSHYPDRIELVAAMADLAIEELTHYREVLKWIHRRGLITTSDQKDPYVGAFRRSLRQGSDIYFLDRLLTASIIEARGAERFSLVAEALEPGPLKKFYQSIIITTNTNIFWLTIYNTHHCWICFYFQISSNIPTYIHIKH